MAHYEKRISEDNWFSREEKSQLEMMKGIEEAGKNLKKPGRIGDTYVWVGKDERKKMTKNKIKKLQDLVYKPEKKGKNEFKKST